MADKSQKFIVTGKFSGSSTKMSLAELIKVSLRRDIKDRTFRKLNGKNQINEIIKFLNNNDVLEYSHISLKRIVAKSFDWFWKDQSKKTMFSLSMVFRLKDETNHLFRKNTVLLEVDLIKRNNSADFKLNNIILMDLPIDEHRIVTGLRRIRPPLKIIINAEECLEDHEFLWLKGLEPPLKRDKNIDFFSWLRIVETFVKFDEHRKKNSMKIAAVDNKCIIDGKKRISIYALVPKDFKFGPREKYFINNEGDANWKGRFYYYNKSKNYFSNIHESCSKSINNYGMKINEMSKMLKIKEKEKNSYESKMRELEQDLQIEKKRQKAISEDLHTLEQKVMKDDATLNKPLASNPQWKRIKQQLKPLNKIIKDLEKQKKDIEKESQKVRKEISTGNEDLSVWKEKLKTEQQKMETLDLMEEENKELLKLDGGFEPDDRITFRKWSIDPLNIDEFLKEGKEDIFTSELSDYDKGAAVKIMRFYEGMKRLMFGTYKSPYLAISLNDPSIPIKLRIKETKGLLNEKQKDAFLAINNSYQSSFLQGPPGTGKTQIISNFISYQIDKGAISLISSSTNEAINNAMDRLWENSKTNPNAIFLRISASADQLDKVKNYVENRIPNNFIEKMMAAVKENYNIVDDLAKEIIEKFTKKDLLQYIPLKYQEKYFTEEYIMSDIKFFTKMIGRTIEGDDIEYDEIEASFKKYRFKTKSKLVNRLEYNLIEEFFEKKIDKHNDYKITTFDFIKKFTEASSPNKKLELIQCIKEKCDKHGISKDLHEQIINIVEENNLVNVIGITTTSKPCIKLNGKEKEIFVEYPVDFAVIDEVSKTITPEIIQISILSSKFLFAGDYRQLPPVSDISETYIEELWKWNEKTRKETMEKKKFDDLLDENEIKDSKAFQEYLENNLYGKSLFKKQVFKMKEKKTMDTSYVALNVQHRFTEDIQKLVNVVYDDDEKLMIHEIRKHMDFEIDGPKTKGSINLIDTSLLSKDFIDLVNRKVKKGSIKDQIKPNDVSFDQSVSFLTKEPVHYISKINEYNAFVGLKTLLQLKRKNPDISPDCIGYISMTRSQANHIKKMINMKGIFMNISDEIRKWLKGVQIDTVDNFQGREKQIIIVDLVRAQNSLDDLKKGVEIRKRRNLEFYSRCERLNVAMSRAKDKLILIGAVENYLAHEVISEVDYANGKKEIKLFDKFLDIIYEDEGLIREWER